VQSLSPRSGKESKRATLLLQDTDITFVAKWSFEPTVEKVELKMRVGDVLRVTQKRGEWWKGVNEKGQKGWFPAARVVPATAAQREQFDKQIKTLRDTLRRGKDTTGSGGSPRAADADKNGEPAPVTMSASPDDEFPSATVLFDYTARSETELTVKAGKVVLIVSQDNADWWEAEIDGEVGYLPRNFVRLNGGSEPAPLAPANPAPSDGDEASKRKTLAVTGVSRSSPHFDAPVKLASSPSASSKQSSSPGVTAAAAKKATAAPPPAAASDEDDGSSGSGDDSGAATVMAPPARSAPPPPVSTAQSRTPAVDAIKASEALSGELPRNLSPEELVQHHALLAAAALRVCRELRARLTPTELKELQG
jgi:uncharacterized protein YgiM (DUF1202 family)